LPQASLEAFAHATEDVGRVSQALLNLLPPALRDRVKISYEAAKGHYDNPITILRVSLRGEDVELLLKSLAKSMSDLDKQTLKATLRLRVDEDGCLHLRFEKAAAYKGWMKLAEGGEVIKVKASIPSSRRRDLEAYLAEIGLTK
jgi:RNA binding exosome subunit